ncbi:TetR/AcrR family transcriptional regulator [Amycolatopsis magusensis]|uniref:TetR/AcrR family transcriptional regulator n=1 Tax=Amycolatopsis magusensis TaxID=882444 RepID=UPI00379EB20B
MTPRNSGARSAAETRERFLQAGIQVLADQGVAGLTVRTIAATADSSTIAVYSRFGGRAGMLQALYHRAFEQLGAVFAALPPCTDDRERDVCELALAYRRFALENPPRYAFMFERALADFAPDPELRHHVLQSILTTILGRATPAGASEEDGFTCCYLLWTTMHGLISAEMLVPQRNPLRSKVPVPDEQAREELYRAGVRAITHGLAVKYPAGDHAELW